ncbi:MAG TPA: thioesterase domain-containing protein [Thermoanaerobaculia bacterium]|jgi:medium-chain acyl-[acyl-carrier-protein] hydrolase|nr:thioesterase domain-containing protein [Thermoanaerobaculia bacterium]
MAARANPWLPALGRRAGARLRLFCFPYAGGGTAAFRDWQRQLPGSIEVCPVLLPGREARIGEPAVDRLRPLVAALEEALATALDLPYAFFGHSVGALVAFELARALRRRGTAPPAHLFVSAHPAPQLPERERRHDLPDDELIAELRRFQGTPDEVLDHPELMRLLLPTLRRDFAVAETCEHVPEPPLDSPITAFGGLADPRADRGALLPWQEQTRGAFKLRMFPGGHFFLDSDRDLLLQTIAGELQSLAALA